MGVLRRVLAETEALNLQFTPPDGAEDELCRFFLRLEGVLRLKLQKEGCPDPLLEKAAYCNATRILGWGLHDGLKTYQGGAVARLAAASHGTHSYQDVIGHVSGSYLYFSKVLGWMIFEQGSHEFASFAWFLSQLEG